MGRSDILCPSTLPGRNGFSLLEALIVVAIIGILAAIANNILLIALEETKEKKAIQDIECWERRISEYQATAGHLPDSLDELDGCNAEDPWGNPYRYLRIDGGSSPRGKWRKDRFLVPLNADFDLYSMGPDGESVPPLTANASRDDIVRAGDGTFVGPADEY
jgi:general secretion pathway protein G